jgi:DNA-binding transcriptional MerR regulator
VKSDTIRFYERCGLLPKPQRRANGYRVYDEAALSQVRFIRNAQSLGFSLDEIRRILSLRGRGRATCRCVLAMAEATLSETESRLKQLREFRDALAMNLKRWKRQAPARWRRNSVRSSSRPRTHQRIFLTDRKAKKEVRTNGFQRRRSLSLSRSRVRLRNQSDQRRCAGQRRKSKAALLLRQRDAEGRAMTNDQFGRRVSKNRPMFMAKNFWKNTLTKSALRGRFLPRFVVSGFLRCCRS